MAAACIVYGCSLPLFAQQAPIFRTETVLMEVEVKVTDKDGRPIPNLEREDFTLFENGQPQTIRTFEYVDEPAGETREDQPQAPRSPLGPGRPGQADPQDALPHGTTWIYITGHVNPEDRKRAWRGLTEFLDESLRPGVLVSVEGSNFTSKRAAIDDSLRSLVERRGKPGFLAKLENDTERATFADIEYDPAFQSRVDKANKTLADLARLQINYSGDFFVYRYIDLVKSLSTLPGKKVVVLLAAPGTLGNYENSDLVRRLIGEAVRARVTFHVVEVNRLSAKIPFIHGVMYSGFIDDGSHHDAVESAASNSPILNFSLTPSMLSNPTGGKSAKSILGLGRVLTAASESLRGYYLLGYSPAEPDLREQARNIRVEVSRPGLKLDYRKTYYQDTPFERLTSKEKRVELIHYVKYDTAFTDIPLTVAYDFFRGGDGQPTLYASLGIHSSYLPVRPKKKSKLRFTLLAQARDLDREVGPVLFGRDVEIQANAKYIENFQKDPSAVLHVPIEMKLKPGDHEWKIVLRDEFTGNIGTYKTNVRVPDFTGPERSSSLLLTGCFAAGAAESAERNGNASHDADAGLGGVIGDGRRFYIDSSHTYRKGEPLYLIYDLYGLQAPDETSLPATRLMLMKDQQQAEPPNVTVFKYDWQPEQERIRYVLALDSNDLDPGDYQLLAVLPNGKDAIYRNFHVVAEKHPDIWLDPRYALTSCAPR